MRVKKQFLEKKIDKYRDYIKNLEDYEKLFVKDKDSKEHVLVRVK